MAELNFGLLTPPGSQSIGNAFVSGMDQAAASRAQENQNAMSQYSLSKARREDALSNQLLGDLRNATTPEEIYRAYQRVGKPEVASKMQGEALTRKKLEGDIAGQPFKLLLDQGKVLDSALDRYRESAVTVQTPEAAAMHVQQAYADPTLAPYLNKIMPLEQALTDTQREFAANPDRWRTTHTNQKGLALVQAAMPKPQVVGNTIANMNPVAGQVGAPIAGAPLVANTAKDLLIPDPNNPNKLVPNAPLIDVQTGLRKAGASNLSVKLPPVEGEFGKTFAKDVGEADVKLRNAALDAPTMAATANQTLKLLEDPKIFTGGAANIKLGLARALNVIGDTDTTSIANTEKLIQSTGAATLASIKTSGLGTGQGFTDKDLKMLQGVAGGTIELNADTLRSFATAQHNAAAAMVKKWEARRKNIPATALSGTGIDKETYSIEPKFSAYVSTKSLPDGRVLGKRADGTIEVVR
jgi:hypothetical protein